MIYDKLKNILRYKGIHPNLDLALDYIHGSLDAMPQHVDILGKEVYGNIYAYETIPTQQAYFEAHAQYADIQILRSGHERIAVSDVSVLEVDEVRDGKDFWALHGPEEASLLMDDSVFVIVLPGDAHKLKMQVDGPEAVTKSVFKVKMV